MEEVVKSPNDTREYRVIKLENGLTAMLISDLKSKTEKFPHEDEDDVEGTDEDEDCSDLTDDDEDMEYSDEEDDEEEDDSGDEDGRGDADDEGNMRKKKSGTNSEKMAAAALCVGIGSFSDPADIPGLAHFLEHMVFMGSEKYPDENSFDDFTKKHGGNDNACTDCETTVFQFDIHTKYFKDGLDRFAQFFISPLMKEDSTDREIEAVDSEFQMSLTSDEHRKQQLIGTFAKDGHPMGKFMWGNTKTLKTDPVEKNLDVQKRLHDFQKRMYSAQYMTLAVQSRETLDTLEEWVREIFCKIPNNNLPSPSFSDEVNPFVTPKFHQLYKLVPVKNIDQVEITWALPSLLHHYRIKPLHYLSWLTGHEGSGSILALLKKKYWALELYSGNDDSGFESNSTHAVFSVTATLTDDGYENLGEVISIIFQYIKMLQTQGPQRRIYEEIQTIEDNEFRFQEQSDPVEYVQDVVTNMQYFPTKDYLTGDQLMFEYNEQVIANVTNMLTPETANIMLLSKKHEGKCEEVEPWYQTKYSVEEIPEQWSKAWQNLDINPDLHLPVPNKFIARDFHLKESDREDTPYPVKIIDDSKGILWYKRDNKFKVPKGCIYFHLISPLVNTSPQTLCWLDFFTTILEHNLSETAYAADVAQLTYHFTTLETGLGIKLAGLNHKLPLLFETIVYFIAGFSITDDLFQVVKEQMTRSYHNHIIKPSKLVNDVRLSILQDKKWTPVDKKAIVSTVTKDEILKFAHQFTHNLYIEGLVQGNLSSQEAVSFFTLLSEKLQPSSIPTNMLPEIRVVQLPKDVQVCKIRNFNQEDSNSLITNYYQAGPGDLKLYTLIEWLAMRMEEPVFDILRTQEQLGYVVFAMCRNTFGILGFSITVNTQASKFSVAHVDHRIDAFLQQFVKTLQDMPDSEFEIVVNSLIKLKMVEDLYLAEEVNRNWYEITSRTYLFERLEKEIASLKVLTKDEVIKFLKDHMTNGDECRKLSVQVVGRGEHEQYNQPLMAANNETNIDPDTETDSPDNARSAQSCKEQERKTTSIDHHDNSGLVNGEVSFPVTDDEVMAMEFLPLDDGKTDEVIRDISEWKKNLFVFPVSKLDH
ncbi:nardilysin-like [Glandiceps talaboti]